MAQFLSSSTVDTLTAFRVNKMLLSEPFIRRRPCVCCMLVFPWLTCSGIDQLQKILKVTGTPEPSLVQKMQSKDVRFPQPAGLIITSWLNDNCRKRQFQISIFIIFCICFDVQRNALQFVFQAQTYVKGLPSQRKKNFKEVFLTMDASGAFLLERAQLVTVFAGV